MAGFHPNAIDGGANSNIEGSRYSPNGVQGENDNDIQHTGSDVGQHDDVSLGGQPVEVNAPGTGVRNSKLHEKTVIPSNAENENSPQKLPSKEVFVNRPTEGQKEVFVNRPTEGQKEVFVNRPTEGQKCSNLVGATGESAADQSLSADVVDGEVMFKPTVATSIDKPKTVSPKPRKSNNSTERPANSTTSTNNEILPQLLDACKDLIGIVIVLVGGTRVTVGTASLISWWTWAQYKKQHALNELLYPDSPTTAELMIRVQSTFAAKLEMADCTVFVEFHIGLEKVTVPSWTNTCYQMGESSSFLLCQNVPKRVCEHLQSRYIRMCDILNMIHQDPSLAKTCYVIGHCNGKEKKIYPGVFRDDFLQSLAQNYRCLALDEPASNIFGRMMNISDEECYNLLNNMCPGDQSVFVIRFGNDLEQLKKLYRKQ